MDNYKFRLKAIARAYLNGDAYAVDYQRILREFAIGNGKQIWVTVALHNCLKHLKVF